MILNIKGHEVLIDPEDYDKILIVNIALPQAGKSTWSISTGQPIINRDSIRYAISPFPRTIRYFKEEERVSEIEKIMTIALFKAGHDVVIIDATHLKRKYRDAWEEFANEISDFKCKVIYKKFFTSLEECVKRAQKNFPEDKNFPNVIYNMWRNAEIDFHIPDQRRLCESAADRREDENSNG